MNVCFVCGEYPPAIHGGIGSMTQTIGRALVGAGHGVRVVGCYPGLESVRHEQDQGVEVWRLPATPGRLRWLQTRRMLYRTVAAWARSGQVDLIEVPDWQGWAASWPRLPVPVISRLNGSASYFAVETGGRRHWLTARLEASSLRRADFVVSVSRYTAARTMALFGLRRAPDAILPNPVPSIDAGNWTERQPGMVVFSGTLTAKKGVIPLVEAWPHIVERRPGATLHLAGKDGLAPDGGSMSAYLQRRLGPAVSTAIFYGHQPRHRVLDLLRRARVAVFPSFSEAFAIAPLEAMAAGAPTISSALGSGPELVTDGLDGLTVDPRDPRSIAAAVRRLLEDEPLARRLAETGRARVLERCSIERLLPANELFYTRCIERHGHRAGRLATTVDGPSTSGAVARFGR